MSSVDLYTFITGNPKNAEYFEQFLLKVGLISYYEFVCLVQEIFRNEDEPKKWGAAIRTLSKKYLDTLPVSDEVRQKIKTKISKEQFARNMFDEAVEQVWSFLSKESYNEFIYYLQISEKNDQSTVSSVSKTCNTILQPSTSSSSHSTKVNRYSQPSTNLDTLSQNLIHAALQRSQNFNLGAGPSNQEKLNRNPVPVKVLNPVSRESRGQDCDCPSQNQSSGAHSDDDPHHDTSPVTDVQGQEEEKPVECIINTCDDFQQQVPRWPSAKKSEDVKCFARKLTKKLEHVKQQRDYMAFLTKKLKEQAGDKSSDDDDILNEHVKTVWADDSPPAKREYKSRDCPSNPYHAKHAIPKSRTFPAPSTSKGDPDSGISVVSMSTYSSSAASMSRSGRSEEFSSCSTSSYGESGRKHGAERSNHPVKSKRWWKKVKELPAVVYYHGNPVPFSFVIPTATDKITLKWFKKCLPQKGTYRYLFQYSGKNGVGTEEIFEDTSEIPIFNGKIVATIKPFF